MKIKHFVIFLTIVAFLSCEEQPQELKTIKGVQININDSIDENTDIEKFIKPYRDNIATDLNKVLSYSPEYLGKTSDNLNTTIGNLMADIVYEQANPIFKERTGNTIDFVLLNYGGIRANIPQGNITTQTVYDVMPFENYIVVAELPYDAVVALKDYLVTNQKAHPVSKQFYLELIKDGKVATFKVNNKPLDKNKTYFVATSNYLINGGDKMDFFKNAVSSTSLDYLVRNAMIDYFKKTDTIQAAIDHRFYITK